MNRTTLCVTTLLITTGMAFGIPSPATAAPVPVAFTNSVLTVTGGALRNFTLGCNAGGSVTVNAEVSTPVVACAEVQSLRVRIRPGAIGPRANRIDLRGVTRASYTALTGAEVDGGLGKDTVYGSPFNDHIMASGTIYGFDGDDVLFPADAGVATTSWGGNGDDILHTTDLPDSLNGGAGNDSIGFFVNLQSGNDTVLAGAGNDLILMGEAGTYYGGTGDDSFAPRDIHQSGSALAVGSGGRDTLVPGYDLPASVAKSPLATTAVVVTSGEYTVEGTGIDHVTLIAPQVTLTMQPATSIDVNFNGTLDITVPGGVWTQTADQVTAPNLQPVTYLYTGEGEPAINIHPAA